MPLLGVCLGHQTLGQALGGKIVKSHPLHGKISTIVHEGAGLFKGIPSPFEAARYHSLVIERASCPAELSISAQTDEGIIMAVHHQTQPLYGLQFHPESIATAYGEAMIQNFLDIL